MSQSKLIHATITRRSVLSGIAASATGTLLSATLRAATTPEEDFTEEQHITRVVPMLLPTTLMSPTGKIAVIIDLVHGRVTYAVQFNGREVIRPSALGLKLDGAPSFDSCFKVTRTSQTESRSSWNPPYGERATFPDNFNGIDLEVEETIPPSRRLTIEFRAYDEGLAFRYRVPIQPALSTFVIDDEATEFRVPEGTYGYATHTAQGLYKRLLINDLPRASERPFLLELPGGPWAAIAEAAVENYPSMFVVSMLQEPHSLSAKLMGPAQCHVPFVSPWRVILAAESPGQLLEHNYLLQNLCPPSRIANTDWIKPGKVMREMTLSTRGGHELVDFAASQNIQYIEYDAGWYGDQDDESSDATKIDISLILPRAEAGYRDLNLKEVIRYARCKGIGVILYINRRAMERQLDAILPLYVEWGVAGIKYGFVNVHTQPWTSLLYEAIRKAGQHRILLDIHDEFRPTGMSRTYPNLLTQEGVRGNEEMPTATHNTILAFTRMLAGAADCTFCWFDPRLKNTWGHQMGFTVVIYSPLQFIYWYDRPTIFTPSNESPGMEWFRRLPTVWDDTRVLGGSPGQFAAIARRKGNNWYLGIISNDEARHLKLSLDMLDPGHTYAATSYIDGNGPRDVQRKEQTFRSDEVLELDLQARGGAAVSFTRQS